VSEFWTPKKVGVGVRFFDTKNSGVGVVFMTPTPTPKPFLFFNFE
jgi:hypothetical protein